MANIKSSKKDIRRIAKRTARNTQVKSTFRTLGKKVLKLAQSGDIAATQVAARAFVSALDKAAKRGIIHANKANRHKSAVAQYVFAST